MGVSHLFSVSDRLYLKAVKLEKQGKALDSVEFYMAAFKLNPNLEDEEVAAAVVQKVPF